MMTFKRLTSASVAALAAASATPAIVYAQQTDGAIRGSIVDSSGAAIPGARVTITHLPSGTTDVAVASGTGSFFEGGLRVGGPYSIAIDAPGFEGRRIEGIFLQPGNAERVIIDLAELRVADEVVVYGTRSAQIDLNNGAGSAFDRDQILNQPSVSRDITDTLIRDPLVNSTGSGVLAIAGVNPRFNALAIDGVLQGDDFGLSSSIFATQQGSPISLDAIEAASVVASDYSVTASGFRGGLVNVVTKSGTNEFNGSGYWFRSGQGFVGDVSDGQLVETADFKEREWGFSLGGPIIKDKLFFFANLDNLSSSRPVNFQGSDEGRGIIDSEQFFSALNQRILEGTGFDGGGRPVSVAVPSEVSRFLGKIDWNISDDHRFEGSYQRTREDGVSTSSTSFQSAFYAVPRQLDSYSFGLYSDWSDALSTEVRLGIKDQINGQNCNAGATTSQIDIEDITAASLLSDPLFAGTVDPNVFTDASFVSGCDRFRHANEFDDNRIQAYAAADYSWGDHVTKFGAEWENYELRNLFVQGASGRFRYDDLAELASNTNVDVAFNTDITGDPRANAAAEWGYQKLSLFLQDDWQVTSNFALNVGLRYERFFQSDEPPLRQDFVDAFGRDNLDNLDGIDIFQPRFGFRYEPFERTTVTGGFGLFSGGNPQVWVSNAFQPQIFQVSGTFDGVTPGVIPDQIANDIAALNPNTPAFIDTIDPDFEIPAQWKGSFRVDQAFDMNFGFLDLGSDYRLTVQYLFSEFQNDFRWRNIAQTDLGLTQGVAPDGRPIYADLQDLNVQNAIELTNIDGGRSHVVSVALAKEYEWGFNFDVSYAYQDVTSVTPGTSSRAVSNFRGQVTADRNNPEIGTAPFETAHAFNVSLGYEGKWIRDLTTRVDLFGTITSGQPFSYTFNVNADNPLFGRQSNFESPFDNDLLYIPTVSGGASTDGAVVFASGFDGAAFEQLLDEAGIEQGQIFARNSDRSNWNSLWSFRFQQDLPTPNFGWKPLEGNQLKLVVDIFNVANLINDKWGTQFNGPGFDTVPAVTADLVSAADVAANGVDGATALEGDSPRTTCLSAGDCVYRFNTFSERPVSIRDLDDSVYRIRVGIRYDF